MFTHLNELLGSPLVSEVDCKRAAACYRRVQSSGPLSTAVHIGHDVHIFLVKRDKTLTHERTLKNCTFDFADLSAITIDNRTYNCAHVDLSAITVKMFGLATRPPLTQMESKLRRQESLRFRELFPSAKMPELNTHTNQLSCDACNSVHSMLKKCSRCHCARYCNAECQANDWPLHKLACTPGPAPRIPRRTLSYEHVSGGVFKEVQSKELFFEHPKNGDAHMLTSLQLTCMMLDESTTENGERLSLTPMHIDQDVLKSLWMIGNLADIMQSDVLLPSAKNALYRSMEKARILSHKRTLCTQGLAKQIAPFAEHPHAFAHPALNRYAVQFDVFPDRVQLNIGFVSMHP
jgi:hypothetical protein